MPERVHELERKLDKGELQQREAKMELAGEITAIFWGLDGSNNAADNFRQVFREGSNPAEMQETLVHEGDGIVDIIVKCGFARSRSDARRLIKQGGVRLEGAKVSDQNAEIVLGGDAVLQVGRRRFARLRPI